MPDAPPRGMPRGTGYQYRVRFRWLQFVLNQHQATHSNRRPASDIINLLFELSLCGRPSASSAHHPGVAVCSSAHSKPASALSSHSHATRARASSSSSPSRRRRRRRHRLSFRRSCWHRPWASPGAACARSRAACALACPHSAAPSPWRSGRRAGRHARGRSSAASGASRQIACAGSGGRSRRRVPVANAASAATHSMLGWWARMAQREKKSIAIACGSRSTSNPKPACRRWTSICTLFLP